MTLDQITFVAPADSTELIIEINGRALFDLVREIELPFAQLEGHPKLAGQYSGLPLDFVRTNRGHFLGTPDRFYSEGGDGIYVGICECGEPGCWPLCVHVEVRDDLVRWHGFSQPHRTKPSAKIEWSHEKLGEFRFDRVQYEQALSEFS